MNSSALNSSSSSLVWLTRDSAACRSVCSRASSARRSAEVGDGGCACEGDGGCEVERPAVVVLEGRREERRDWKGARVVLEASREGGEGGIAAGDFRSRSSSS